VLFVRRGQRPGLFAPKENVTQFKWSMAGTPSGLMFGGRSEGTSEEGDVPPLQIS
jgi:hypothetical protein